jgi:glycosyltransferase involved in cell wall biosynthesis
LLWRNWGNQNAAMQALAALDPPPNVTVERRDGRPMPAVYHAAHAVIYCCAAGFGKAAPNSVLEGMACGRPALVTTTCELAASIVDGLAGVAAEPTPVAIATAIDQLGANYDRYANGARRLAERHFDLADFLDSYRRIYAGLDAERRRTRVSMSCVGS